MEQFKFLFVYDKEHLSNNTSIDGVVCSKIIEFCDYAGTNYNYINFEYFKIQEQELISDNTIIYYCIHTKNILDLMKVITSYNTSLCNIHVILSCESSDHYREEFIFKLNLNEIIKKANIMNLCISCIELDENSIDSFFKFIKHYNTIETFEINKIIKISKKENKNYDKNINLESIMFNCYFNSSCLNKYKETNTIFEKEIHSFQNIQISGILRHKPHNVDPYIPNIVYELLQNASVKSSDDNFFINHYFDKIFVLYLKRRDNKALKELKKHNITNYTLFEGIDAKESINCNNEWNSYQKLQPLKEEIHALNGKKRRAIASVGSWSILKSMYNMLVEAKEKNYNRILVLQDDVIFHKNFVQEFRKKLKYIREDWKLLYLGASQHVWDNIEIINETFYNARGSTDGAFAVGIHCSVYDALMKNILKFLLPFDSGPLWEVQRMFSDYCFVLYENIIIADVRISDLRYSRDIENFSKMFRWNLDNFNIDDTTQDENLLPLL